MILGLYWGYIGLCWGYIGLYWGYIGLFWGYMGIMEKKMETTIMDSIGFRMVTLGLYGDNGKKMETTRIM